MTLATCAEDFIYGRGWASFALSVSAAIVGKHMKHFSCAEHGCSFLHGSRHRLKATGEADVAKLARHVGLDDPAIEYFLKVKVILLGMKIRETRHSRGR